MITKILFAGDGGQGVQMIAGALTRAAFATGLFVAELPNYGLEQRGGVSLAFITISDKPISYPKFTKPDILLVMSPQAKERTLPYVSSEVTVYSFETCQAQMKEGGVKDTSANLYYLGCVAKQLAKFSILSSESVLEAVKEKLGAKPNWIENEQAYMAGLK